MPTPLLVKSSTRPALDWSKVEVIDLGRMDFRTAYKKQRQILEKRKAGLIPDTLILTEHPTVITIGRTGSRDNIFTDEIEVIQTDRGGDVTLHCPGQLVAYLIFDLTNYGCDLHKWLRILEDFIIDFLAQYQIEGERRSGVTGVWVKGKKIASIGMAVSRWVSYHGFSINVNPDLSIFNQVRSCGIRDIEITSIEKELSR